MQRRTLLKAFALSASVVAMGMSFGVQAADTIKVGIMHSLSGTLESPLMVETTAVLPPAENFLMLATIVW